MEQAILVAKKHPINISKVKQWCKNENASWAYDELIEEMKK